MPREVRTDVLISAKTKGFAQAQQEAARIARENSKAIDAQVKGFTSSGKAMGAVEKEVKRLEEVLQGLAKRQVAINRLMEGMGDKATPEYKALAQELKNVDREAQRVTRTMGSLDRAFSRQREQRQGFTQGLMQGVAPGAMTFLQRGPGMRRQMMGAALGAGARRTMGAAGAALQGGMFSGLEGMITGLQGIPVVGGLLAAPMQRAVQQAQQAVAAQQVQLQTMPFLGGVGLQTRAAGAARRAGRPAERQARERVLGRLGSPEMEKDIRIRTHKMLQQHSNLQAGLTMEGEARGGFFENLQLLPGGENAPIDRIRRQMEARSRTNQDPELQRRAERQQRENVEREIRQEADREGNRARRRASSRARARVMRESLGLGRGVQFGMDINAERQFRAQLQQAGGGFGITRQERRMGVTGMAAQTAFGVGAGVSGAFLQAGRRGGLEGARGGASRMLTDSLADAMKMGLEGSEINDYLQQMASGITAWKSTGIPFNKQSMADIAGTLGTMGMGGVRGMAVAGGVSRAAEQLARTGPQSVGQLMMLQTLGGMTPGKTGMEAMEDALIRLEKKQFSGKEFEQLIQGLLQAGGGGAEGRRIAYGVLQQAGIQISRGELKEIGEGASPERLEEIRRQRAAGEKMAKRTAETPAALARAAQEAVPSALKRQAALTNQQIQNGKQLVGAMKTLEETAQKFTKMVTDLLAPIVEALGGDMKKFAEAVERAKAKATASAESFETGPS